MNGLELISENQAAKEAGVSAKTLARFSEAGYLTVEVRGDGSRMYSRSQINDIFGTFQAAPSVVSSAQATTAQPAQTASVEMACKSTQTTFRPDPDASGSTYYSPVQETPIVERVTVEAVTSATAQPLPTETIEETVKLKEEAQRLRNLVNLQERILDMKDAELQDLRSQRDWLRTRVEKLEEKGDRDQVLLLSETQAIRQLIGVQQRPRSSMRTLLEWFGLGDPEVRHLPSNEDISRGERHGASTIVVNRAANN